MRKHLTEPEKDNSDRWLLTYADLITLLLIFFVVLYSISKVDANKFQAIAESLSLALGGGTPARIEISRSVSGPKLLTSGNPPAQTNSSGPENQDKTPSAANPSLAQGTAQGLGNVSQENMTIQEIKAKLDKFAAANHIQTTLVSSIEERGLVISIQDTLLFDSGSADITPGARAILEKVSAVLAPVPNYIRVEGNTDNLPIRTAQFPSNWELSVLRATNVVRILAADGNISPDRLSAIGYSKYRPIASNDTVAGRAKNRRVDLVVLRTKYDLTEPAAASGATTSGTAAGTAGTSASGSGTSGSASPGTGPAASVTP
ncbi:OmpA-like domain protein [Acididesulfobacillus acetoxydans]|uniref:OmpA protein n=1 Tax=Acididesulfobacillus acetoxydans TaxID=1561005 RepID=A0A8S0VYM5_9FIRM|nr:flagellar motor protein MotB [Acididesulfobacillus acetoxydans]CAA7603193.1 OmpA-like domain protein [Acididesulfobacillus acetoxydans]CEJ07579.1 OmpA protein [Acididesulfobacillus acetoxydans]